MSTYSCTSCGYSSVSWYGRCPSCSEFNTFIILEDRQKKTGEVPEAELKPLSKIKAIATQRMKTAFVSVDQVLGGGIVAGEAILLSGEPGVGKSTLLLKILSQRKILYFSGEESGEQIRLAAQRVSGNLANFLYSDAVIVESIIKAIRKQARVTDIVVIDSVQTIYSQNIPAPAGTISQIKYVVLQLVNVAKTANVAIILVGHITKGGQIAGPKALEHLVDCVLYLEGEPNSNYRILRALKNRFGSTDEIGVFEMKGGGLAEVEKSTVFLEDGLRGRVGKAIAGVVEGSRSLFFEIQSLVVPTNLAIPRRVVSGVDFNKVQLLLAVVRKYLKLPLDKFDVFVNVAGGVKIDSTAADIGIIASVISSFKNIPVPQNIVFAGEVGLLGEVRSVAGLDKLEKETKRYKFDKLYSRSSLGTVKDIYALLVK